MTYCLIVDGLIVAKGTAKAMRGLAAHFHPNDGAEVSLYSDDPPTTTILIAYRSGWHK